MLTDAQIVAMSPDERLDLIRRLNHHHQGHWHDGLTRRNVRRRTLTMTTIGSLLLIPWTIYLGLKLPPTYRATHWDITWVGFDTALVIFLGFTAYLTWQRRQLLMFAAFTTAVLLLCDAWFDVTTAGAGDLDKSLYAALLIELPLAARLLVTSVRVAGRSSRRMWELSGRAEPPSLWTAPIFALDLNDLPADLTRVSPH